MSPPILLATYCAVILVASLAGGWVPLVVHLTHRRMEIALSFVSGVMLGIAFLDLLPHALKERAAWLGVEHAAGESGLVMLWVLAGFLAMFFIERWFCYHHHEPPDNGEPVAGRGGHGPHHEHALSWGGAAVGLTVHSLVAGAALAASVKSQGGDPGVSQAAGSGATLVGFGTFLAIVLHKPFDALTIGTLMAAGRHTTRTRHLVNGLFSLAIPIGAGLLLLGLVGDHAPHAVVCVGLAFATGAFLCIALSDLLPELQFHQHDRLKLSTALIVGLAVAWGASLLH